MSKAFLKNLLLGCVITGFVVTAPALPQVQPCSVNTVGENIHVFACSGLKEQTQDVLKILNRIVTEKLDTRAVLAKLNELPKGAEARSIQLTDVQKKNLLALAKMYPKQRIAILYSRNDAAAAKTAAELLSILSADWVSSDGTALAHAIEYTAGKPVAGIEVFMNDHDYAEQKLPKAAIPLTLALQAMGYSQHPSTENDVPPGTLQIRVGTTP
jgi:hypothetical protein